MRLSVVIVNYNVRLLLDECIKSVEKALDGIEGDIFVVDNNSSDGSVDYIRQRFPEVHLIANAENCGFARANNQAIRISDAEYILLLNPDTVVYENTLRGCLDFMDAHPEAGGVGVRMLTSDGDAAPESRRAVPTPWVAFLKMMGFTRRYYMSHLPWDKPARIEVGSGAFFFLRHYKGESTQKSSFRYVHVFYQAMLIFFRKHYAHLSFLISFPIQTAIYFRALMALVQMMGDKSRRFLNPNKIQKVL